jgi:hypothetical protein
MLSYEEILDRDALRSFLDKPELVDGSPQQFRDELDRYKPDAVCLESSPRGETARMILRQSGFHMKLARKGYELWLRSGLDPDVRTDRRNDGDAKGRVNPPQAGTDSGA